MALKIKNVTSGMPKKCEYCGESEEKDGSSIGLRPYGKNGAWICFDCGMKPENMATTVKQFGNILGENDVAITE